MNHIDQSALQLQESFELEQIVTGWLEAFEEALSSCDEAALTNLLTDDGHWRDILAFTWHLTSRTDPSSIARGLLERQPAVKAKDFQINPDRTPPRRVKRLGRDCIEALFRFETRVGRGEGMCSDTPIRRHTSPTVRPRASDTSASRR